MRTPRCPAPGASTAARSPAGRRAVACRTQSAARRGPLRSAPAWRPRPRSGSRPAGAPRPARAAGPPPPGNPAARTTLPRRLLRPASPDRPPRPRPGWLPPSPRPPGALASPRSATSCPSAQNRSSTARSCSSPRRTRSPAPVYSRGGRSSPRALSRSSCVSRRQARKLATSLAASRTRPSVTSSTLTYRRYRN